MDGDAWDVFVSYGHGDAQWVGTLAGNLHRAGFEVFYDQWELVGGDRVTGRLEDAIRDTTNGVLVVSPHSLSRPWVREEYEALLRRVVENPAGRLIPVLYRDAELPAFLANRLWVDFRTATTGPAYETAFGELERYLRGEAAADRPERGSPRVWPAGARPAGPLRRVLVVDRERVSLCRDDDAELAQQRVHVEPGTMAAVNELRRVWHRRGYSADRQEQSRELDATLAQVGRRLSTDFLKGKVGAALAAAVREAARLNERLELAVQAADLGDLPWESLWLPEPDGGVAALGGTPLALHRNVALFRQLEPGGAVAAYKVRGPLRILAVIASPESQHRSGELLNYEAELGRIVTAVDPARRRGEAYIRVLVEGSLAAIHAALDAEPEGFHVLHLSCHARPGELVLETAGGGEDAVTAHRLLEEGLPAGIDLPMVVLSGCSTGVGALEGQENVQAERGERALGGVAQQLLDAGVPVVLAMQAPVSDAYATDLVGELYEYLATADVPDPLAALSVARRKVEHARQQLAPQAPRRGRAEWATPALWLRGLRVPLFNRREPPGPVAALTPPVLAEGIVVRKVGEFVGRRSELRAARSALAGAKAGVVIHAIGGVGKSTLAAEVITTVGRDRGAVISLRGRLSIDAVLEELGARLAILVADDREHTRPVRAAAQLLRQHDVEWTERWRVLAEIILPAVAMIVLLDNFEDNLQRDDGARWSVRDPELADLLARWARRPGQSKLLLTSRHPFELPNAAHGRLERLHLGPLSPAETTKLIWQLPGLDDLSAEERERAYRNVGGHPRTLEYLDALLRGGRARFDDISEQMEERLSERGVADPQNWMATRERGVDTALAEAITLAVDDVLLDDLLTDLGRTPLARELVIGASVYRVPVDDTALVWQIAEETEQETPDPERLERITRIDTAIEAAREAAGGSDQLTGVELGLTDEELAAYRDDIGTLQRPPVSRPDTFSPALAAARAAGLIAPITRSDNSKLHVVHRWTARAIELLEPERAGEAHHRAARYWRWRVERIPQSQSDDIEQLIEARYHHHAAGEHEAALGLSRQVIVQLQTWGQYGRATELCRETLEWVPDGSPDAATCLHQLGSLAQERGDYDTAERHYTRSLRLNEQLGDEASLAAGHHHLGMIAQLRGDYSTAEQRYGESLQINERLGNQASLASTYDQLGLLARDRSDYDTAEQRHVQALEIRERLGNEATLAITYHNLGALAHVRGAYDAAEQRYTRALQISDRLGNQASLAIVSRNLGILAQDRGDYDTAERRYIQALEINERLGNQTSLAISYHQLGILSQLRSDYDTAEQRYLQALQINERLGNQAGLSSNYHQLGSLAQDRGDHDAAERRYTKALQIDERLGDQAGLATTYGALGTLAHARGDYEAAEQRYAQSLEINERLRNQPGLANVYGYLGALAGSRGDYETAERRYTQALEINERLRNDIDLGGLYQRLGALAQDRGDYETAERRYTQALETSERLGNHAAIAINHARLARLMTTRGDDDHAVAHGLWALALQLETRSQEVGASVAQLAAARSRLGYAAFTALAGELLDEAALSSLLGLLDEHGGDDDDARATAID